jgi:predicted nuclease of predicted toxin-antitoxin system
MLATKVISYEKEIVQLRMEAVKAKEMTKASLQELLVTREELEEANLKLSQYESNVQAVFDSMNTGSQSHAR